MTKTIQLTESQVSAVLEILDIQASRKIGCIAVVNFGFDRTTGDLAVDLSFAALEWADAVAICRKVKKLEAALPPGQQLAHPGPGNQNPSTEYPSNDVYSVAPLERYPL